MIGLELGNFHVVWDQRAAALSSVHYALAHPRDPGLLVPRRILSGKLIRLITVSLG